MSIHFYDKQHHASHQFKNSGDISNIFKDHFFGGELRPADYSEMPHQDIQRITGFYNGADEDKYIFNKLNDFFIINYADGSKSFVANQLKLHSLVWQEMHTHLFDILGKDQYIGRGTVRFSLTALTPFFKDKPYVKYTGTTESLQRNGFGLRRLYVMNALSHALHNLPLNSGTHFVHRSAKSRWEHLVRIGHAERYKREVTERFVFLI